MNTQAIKIKVRVVLIAVFLLASTRLTCQTPVKPLELTNPLPIPKLPSGIVPKPKIIHPQNLINQWLGQNGNTQSQSESIRQQTDLEIQKMQEHRKRTQAILDDALNTFSTPIIQYDLRGNNLPGRERFQEAFTELNQMLEGQMPLSIKRAVFLSEHAYDPTIKWEDFNSEVERMVALIGSKLKQDRISKDDQIAKNMSLFQFFTDTLEINVAGYERPIVTYPMFYDFDDFWGRKDLRNVFVSKLIKTGTGQCHSLPLLYLILAEEIGAKAHLTFSPSHSYIKFQDKAGNWHNIELTNHMLTSDQFVMYSGYIKAEALANELYMNPLSEKEVVAQSLNDLAIAYSNKYGYDDFVRLCTNQAYKHGLKSMSIHKLNFNYFLAQHQQILSQYKQYGLSREDFENDEKAMRVYQNLVGAQKHIEKLGYADMPAEQYERWLNSVQEEGRKVEHQNKMRALVGNRNN